MPKIILASTSPYRRSLLSKLGLPFDSAKPDFDETALPGEEPAELALRLARGKAQSLANTYTNHLIIGGDQVAYLPPNQILSKPGNFVRAFEQLSACSGQTVTFYNGLCLLNSQTGRAQTAVEEFKVRFRPLSDVEIRRYLEREQPYDCAGSFKVESLGITLFESLEGRDPNALVGLPLILLTELLRNEGIELP